MVRGAGVADVALALPLHMEFKLVLLLSTMLITEIPARTDMSVTDRFEVSAR